MIADPSHERSTTSILVNRSLLPSGGAAIVAHWPNGLLPPGGAAVVAHWPNGLLPPLCDALLGHSDGVASITKRARDMGASEAEIIETVGVAFVMGGMPGLVTGANAFRD